MATNGTEKNHPVERVILYVGSILGILTAIFTVFDRLTQPGSPDLTIAFAYSNSQILRVVPVIDSKDASWTRPFPLGLIVSNRGGKTAEEATLSIIHQRGIGVEPTNAEYTATHQLIASAGTDQKILTTIPLGEIHPKQTLHLDDSILAFVENTIDMRVPVTTSDNIPAIINLSLLVTYDIQMQLAAKDTPERTSSMFLSIGNKEQMEKAGQPYWEAIGTQMMLRRPGEKK